MFFSNVSRDTFSGAFKVMRKPNFQATWNAEHFTRWLGRLLVKSTKRKNVVNGFCSYIYRRGKTREIKTYSVPSALKRSGIHLIHSKRTIDTLNSYIATDDDEIKPEHVPANIRKKEPNKVSVIFFSKV